MMKSSQRVAWIGLTIVAFAVGRWSRPDANESAFSSTNIVPGSLLGKRRVSQTAGPLDHPCLSAPVSSLPAMLEKARERSISGTSFEVMLIAARWFETDRKGLLEWLDANGDPQPLYAIVSRWRAREDPEEVWQALGEKRDQRDPSLYEALIDEDPAKVFAQEDQSWRFRQIGERWAEADFAAAEEAVKKAKEWKQSFMVQGLAKVKAAQLPFEEALAWANDFSVMPEIALGVVVDVLAATDLEGAMRQMSELGIKRVPAHGRIEVALEKLPLQDAVDLLRRYALPELIDNISKLPEDPIEAAELLAPIVEDADKVRIHHNWHPATDDIPGAIRALADRSESVAFRLLLEKSLSHWSTRDPETVSAYIRSITDPETQARYAHDYGGRDLSLIDLVDRQLLGDEVNDALVQQSIRGEILSTVHMDPAAAIAEAAAIENAKWRAIAHEWLFIGWAEHNEQAAMEWALTLTPAERLAARIKEHTAAFQR